MIFDVVGRGMTPICTRCCSREAATTRGRQRNGPDGKPTGPLLFARSGDLLAKPALEKNFRPARPEIGERSNKPG